MEGRKAVHRGWEAKARNSAGASFRAQPSVVTSMKAGLQRRIVDSGHRSSRAESEAALGQRRSELSEQKNGCSGLAMQPSGAAQLLRARQRSLKLLLDGRYTLPGVKMSVCALVWYVKDNRERSKAETSYLIPRSQSFRSRTYGVADSCRPAQSAEAGMRRRSAVMRGRWY